MRKPLFVGLVPPRLEAAIYYHFYKPLPEKYKELFSRASMRYAPDCVLSLPRTKDYMYEMIALLGYHELRLTKIVRDLATSGRLFVDVGANVGYFTLLWLSADRNNSAIAIEPSPLVLPHLRENLTINGLESRTTVCGFALGAKHGKTSFDLMGDEATGWGSFSIESTSRSVTVDVHPLDSLIDDETCVDLLKVDVEGAESLVLQGSAKLLSQRRIRNIYVEQNVPGAEKLGLELDNVIARLKNSGFKMKRLESCGSSRIYDWWGTLEG